MIAIVPVLLSRYRAFSFADRWHAQLCHSMAFSRFSISRRYRCCSCNSSTSSSIALVTLSVVYGTSSGRVMKIHNYRAYHRGVVSPTVLLPRPHTIRRPEQQNIPTTREPLWNLNISSSPSAASRISLNNTEYPHSFQAHYSFIAFVCQYISLVLANRTIYFLFCSFYYIMSWVISIISKGK